MEEQIESVEVKTVEPKTIEPKKVEPKAIQINLDPNALIAAGVTGAISNALAYGGMRVISAGCKFVAVASKKAGKAIKTKAIKIRDSHKAKKAEKKLLTETERNKQEAAQAIVAALEAEKAEN